MAYLVGGASVTCGLGVDFIFMTGVTRSSVPEAEDEPQSSSSSL